MAYRYRRIFLRSTALAAAAASSSSVGAIAFAFAEAEDRQEEKAAPAAPAARERKERSAAAARGPAARAARRPGAPARSGEPVYSLAEIARSDGADGRPMWVTYRGGVYDITEFHAAHPGGSLILQAAGGDVQPFWDVWAYHHEAPKVGAFLEKLRIGAVEGADAKDDENATMGQGPPEVDPYIAEPVRDATRQTIFTERPYCSETPNGVLGSSYLTPAEALYVRNHAPVPDCAWVDGEEGDAMVDVMTLRAKHQQRHEVVFEAFAGNDGAPSSATDDSSSSYSDLTFTVASLEARFGTTTITSILQCAGNRASEDMAATGASGFQGTPFETITQGMVGNAQWRGVRLADVLRALYPDACAACHRHGGGEWHVVFEGADGYTASSPLARLLDPASDCLLATHMNGAPLSPDHGYPLRALLPGLAGARNVKWLQSVSLQQSPVDAPWNAYYYKNAKAEQIQELPLQSLILSHERKVGDGVVEVKGVAYGGGTGTPIARVEVSTDGGASWTPARVHTDEILEDGSSKSFGWVRWTARVINGSGDGGDEEMRVCCRATDAQGISQIEVSPKQRGYLYNGWHSVVVE